VVANRGPQEEKVLLAKGPENCWFEHLFFKVFKVTDDGLWRKWMGFGML